MSHSTGQKHRKNQDYIDHSVDVLRRSGGRITKPRLAMLECLARSERSLSANDLMDKIRRGRNMPDVDLATVYRNLEALSSLGLVHRVGPNGEFVACEHPACEVDLHLIVHCLVCDRTREVDVPRDLLGSVKKYIQRSTHYSLEEHFLQMNGCCPDCTPLRRG